MEKYKIVKDGKYLRMDSVNSGQYVFTDNSEFRYRWNKDEKEIALNIAKHYDAELIIDQMETTLTDEQLVKEIEAKIREACIASKYTHLCKRVESEGGMAYVINRCVKMMATDKIKLSTALASLESEFEGVS